MVIIDIVIIIDIIIVIAINVVGIIGSPDGGFRRSDNAPGAAVME